jgi:hypothetical protein
MPFTSIPASPPPFPHETSFSRAMKNYLVKNNYHSTTQDVRKLRVIILYAYSG